MIKAKDFKWWDRVYHLFYLASYLCLPGALTDCFLPLTADFEGKRPGMVNTHLSLSMMILVIREVECDTCDGSPRWSETFLPVLAFE